MSEITDKATEEAKKENPLLKRVNKFPGQTFRLPSKGLLYTDGELDTEVKDGEVTVFPMTTLDEIYMRTPDMLFQGTAIDTVFKRCIPQIKKPLKLYSNDIDFLLTCMRKVSYGEYITLTSGCAHCEEAGDLKVHEYNVPLSSFLQGSREFSAEDVKTLNLTLSTSEKVILRPATFDEMLQIMQIRESEIKTPEEMESMFNATLSATIRSVDNVTDKEMIQEWLAVLPRSVIAEFTSKLEKINRWGPTFDYQTQCKTCGNALSLATIINPLYFFTLPSSPTIPPEPEK